MSVHVLSWVMKHSEAQGSKRLVLFCLADRANDDGWCWPSIPTLARDARLSEATVKTALSGLEREGHVDVEHNRGRGRTNRYCVRKTASSTPVCENSQGTSENSQGTDAKTANVRAENSYPSTREPSVEPSGEEPSSNPRSEKNLEEPEFVEFYDQVYPRRVGRGDALRAWRARRKDGITAVTLLQAAVNFAIAMERAGREKKFIMHPATFLGPDRHWLEFLELDEEGLQEVTGESESLFKQTLRELHEELG